MNNERRGDIPNMENYHHYAHHHAPVHGPNTQPPHGWYYFGPQPPWMFGAQHQWQGPYGPHYASAASHAAAGPPSHAVASGHGGDSPDIMETIDRMAQGDVSAASLGKLFSLSDPDFWKGALVGSAAVLVLSNLPALTSMLGALSKSATGSSGTPGSGAAPTETGGVEKATSPGANVESKE